MIAHPTLQQAIIEAMKKGPMKTILVYASTWSQVLRVNEISGTVWDMHALSELA